MSVTTIELDEKSYGQLLRRTLPHVIRTEEEHDRLARELLRLDENEDLTPEERELAELFDGPDRRIRRATVTHSHGEPTADTPAFDGVSEPHAEGHFIKVSESVRMEKKTAHSRLRSWLLPRMR
jgi:hypothetical protein